MPMPLRAFVMPWTDKSLVAYAASCWIPTQVITDLIDGGLTAISWTGYTNMADFFLKAAPIEQHTTQITGPQYVAALASILAPAAGTSFGDLYAQAVATWGATILDTPGKNADGTPMLDVQGQPVMVAFFAGASIVPLG